MFDSVLFLIVCSSISDLCIILSISGISICIYLICIYIYDIPLRKATGKVEIFGFHVYLLIGF